MARGRDDGMTDAEIDMAMTRLAMNCEKEARQAVKKGALVFKGRLRINAPEDPESVNNSADHIKVTNVKYNNSRPEAGVGFSTKGYKYGWYMHFPNGGTIVRGTMGQPAQLFMERTEIETVGTIMAIQYNAIKKAFDR